MMPCCPSYGAAGEKRRNVFSPRMKRNKKDAQRGDHRKELLKNLPKIDEMMLRIEKWGNLLMLRAGDDRKMPTFAS